MSHCRLLTGCRQLATTTRPPALPLLPFLYQTRSIHNHNHNHRYNRSPRHNREEQQDEDFPFDTNPPESSEGADPDPFAYLYTAQPKPVDRRFAPPTFMPPTHKPARKRTQYSHDVDSPPSSITLREREIFTRIFETILTSPSESTKTTPLASSRSTGLPPPPRLTELFANTIGPQSTGSDLSFAPQQRAMDREGATAAMALASTFTQYPPSLRAAAARAAGLKDWANLQKAEGNVDTEKLSALLSELLECGSDISIVQWLEKKVYILPVDTSSPDTALYADLLTAAMDEFRDSYHDLGSVVAVFERVKALGAESYVLGCTTAVYNRAIAAIWDGLADIHRIRDLVEEMRVNAVGGDMGTASVLRKVVADIEAALEGKRGELAAMMLGAQEIKTMEHLRAMAIRIEQWGSLERPEPAAPADVKQGGARKKPPGVVRRRDPWGVSNYSKANSGEGGRGRDEGRGGDRHGGDRHGGDRHGGDRHGGDRHGGDRGGERHGGNEPRRERREKDYY